jgi:hypothetical protein
MRRILLLAVLIFLAGCVANPMTRDALKKTATEHPGLSTLGTYVSNRSFEQVTASLKRKWQECYNVNRTTTRTQGGMTTSRYRDTYNPKWRKVNNSLVEMTIQMTTRGMVMLSKVPEGGEYIVALDVERLAGNKTRLRWYSRHGWDESWERNKKWSDGKNTACDE